jgi:hypothetical protein
MLPDQPDQNSCVFITFVKLEEVVKNEKGQVVEHTPNGHKAVVV